MDLKIVVVVPLHYSENNVHRILRYIKEAKLKDRKLSLSLTPLFCMSPSIFSTMDKSNFSKYKHDNSANGISMFFDESFYKLINFDKFDYIIYLEESCEPMSRKWALKLIQDLVKGQEVSGWHWVFRGKCRNDSQPILLSNRLSRAIAYSNNALSIGMVSLPFIVLDVPSFRYECIAFKTAHLVENSFLFDSKIFKLGFSSGEIANLSERFYWVENSFLHCPNLQFKLMLDSDKFPFFYPKNIRLFRELNNKLKTNPNYEPLHINFRRINIFHLLKSSFIFLGSIVKFIVIRKGLISKFKYKT